MHVLPILRVFAGMCVFLFGFSSAGVGARGGIVNL